MMVCGDFKSIDKKAILFGVYGDFEGGAWCKM